MHIPKAAWRRAGPLASLVARPVSGDRQTSSSGSAAALQGQVLWAGGPAQRPSEPVGSCRGGRSETQAPRREGEGGSSTEGKWEGTGGERSGRRKQCSPAGWTHRLADGQTNSSTLYPGAVGLSLKTGAHLGVRWQLPTSAGPCGWQRCWARHLPWTPAGP